MNLNAFIAERARRPWETVAKMAGIFIAVFSLLSGIVLLSKLFGWQVSVFAGSLFICLILCIFYAWLMIDIRNTYRRHEKASFVYQDVLQRWHFNEDGSRNVSCEKTMLFYADPDPNEFVDTLFGSLGLSFDDMQYSTKEAQIDRTEQTRSDSYNVFWKPPHPIYAGDVYTHAYSYLFPKGNNPYQKAITIGALTPCRHLLMQVSSDRRIERIRIKEDGGAIRFWDTEKIFAPSEVDHSGYIKNLSDYGFDVVVDRVDLEKNIFILIEFEGFDPDLHAS